MTELNIHIPQEKNLKEQVINLEAIVDKLKERASNIGEILLENIDHVKKVKSFPEKYSKNHC